MLLQELPLLREELGFCRTICGCAFCQAPCRHIPGGLMPADVSRLCPSGQDVLSWAEQHLRALVGLPAPTLVPARRPGGACHWLFDGRCAVHNVAPFGCAFFDSHMLAAEVDRRSAAAVRARQEDAKAQGPHFRVWQHLCRLGLIDQLGDRGALADEIRKIGRKAERQRVQLDFRYYASDAGDSSANAST
jgi:hypothetical protein